MKYFLILLCCALSFSTETILADFEQLTANLLILPKCPPVIFSPALANNPAEQGQALRITAKTSTIPIILKYTIPTSNYGDPQELFFYIKADSPANLEIAFEDSTKITPFEAVRNYLPNKLIKKQWQKAKIALVPQYINRQQLKNIFLKLNMSPETDKEIIYLDSLGFSYLSASKNMSISNHFLIYDFDSAIANRFGASPKAFFHNPATYKLTTTAKTHFGATGQSGCLEYSNNYPATGKIFIPILKNDHRFDAKQFKNILWQMRTETNFKYNITLIYKNNYEATTKFYPHYENEYELSFPDTFWREIIIPLDKDQKDNLIGINITVPANTSGALYLDNICLE